VEAPVPAIEAEPGMLVWVHDQEPPDLHVDDPDNGTDIAGWIREGLIEGLFGIDQTISYYPELLAGEPAVSQREDGTVVVDYELRSGLQWSDGTPLTADDVAYTHQIIIEGCTPDVDGSVLDASNDGCSYDITNRIGYDLVTSFEVTGPTSFTVTFASYFPGWRGMYSQVLAAHAFGQNAAEVNDNLRQWRNGEGTLPSSGPLVFGSWTPGQRLTLVRNEGYHGSVSPDAANQGPAEVEGVTVAFVNGLEAQIDLLLAGEAHMLMTGLDPALERLTEAPEFAVAATPGPEYEHVAINLLDSHLAKPGVREAVAYAIDKAEIVSTVYAPLVGPILAEAGLGNTYWMANQAAYEDHQGAYSGNNVEAAATALEEAGYVRSSEGTWTHPDDGPLVLRAGTTAGDQLREQALALVAEQLGRAGIEVSIESEPGGLYFEVGPFAPEALEASQTGGSSGNGDLWDLALFPWASGPWPGGVSGIYRSGSNSNPYGFTNPEFDVAATDCDKIVSDAERASCYNELDQFVTTSGRVDEGLFMIPLTQVPRYFGYSTAAVAAAGVSPGLREAGPLVNVGDFRLAP
jgi:peptide/nickel transport system substrate-binding protein